MARNPKLVPDRIVRGVAVQVVLLSVIGLMTGNTVFLWILLADFGLRAFVGPRSSPLFQIARLAARRAGGLPRMVAAAPKRFAARLGFGMFLAAVVMATVVHLETLAWIVAAMVMTLAALEAASGFCVGCILYGWMVRAGWIVADDCPTCATNP